MSREGEKLRRDERKRIKKKIRYHSYDGSGGREQNTRHSRPPSIVSQSYGRIPTWKNKNKKREKIGQCGGGCGEGVQQNEIRVLNLVEIPRRIFPRESRKGQQQQQQRQQKPRKERARGQS
ncbi:hypothetical protein RUM43_009916 [Polyplax serrata]|uniref:Uncharacterized protein n=1 Tax=Polyplax serrata TaxID=468196 RepID=A0AAN8PK08_POLSC